jgi:hypothetical protein
MSTKANISSAIVATSGMTAFSYIISGGNHNNFREPNILGKLLHRLKPAIDRPTALAAGWVLHYTVGLIFTSTYDQIWKRKIMQPGLASGSLLGAACGFIAIAVWKTVLSLHPNPPKINFRKFYMQLFPAHVVFGALAGLVYKDSFVGLRPS